MKRIPYSRKERPQPAVVATSTVSPRPEVAGTVLFCVGLLMTWATLTGSTPSGLARYAAYGVGVSLAASLAVDVRYGVANLIRADVMALVALYFLTLFEFLFPQSNFDDLADRMKVAPGIVAVMVGMAGVAIGRHFMGARPKKYLEVFTAPVPPKRIIWVCIFAFVVGYAHQMVAVDFNPLTMLEYYLAPRFAQPWGRGRLGDWKALLVELGLLIYLIPPLAGVVFARRNRYSVGQLVFVGFAFVWTMFYGFSSGTRNIFASFLATFVIGYAFGAGNLRPKQVMIVGAACAVIMFLATRLMLNFRPVGLAEYLKGNRVEEVLKEESLFVDYNLYVICEMVSMFPERYKFLGWEVPYLALVRPIPRAIWLGKPEGLSITMEEAMGVEGLTLASSFVGEAYMIDGYWTVFVVGAFFGALASWWSRMASPRNSDFGVLIYASGFFSAVISMRSLYVFTTAVLPTIAAIIGGKMLLEKVQRHRKQAAMLRRSY